VVVSSFSCRVNTSSNCNSSGGGGDDDDGDGVVVMVVVVVLLLVVNVIVRKGTPSPCNLWLKAFLHLILLP